MTWVSSVSIIDLITVKVILMRDMMDFSFEMMFFDRVFTPDGEEINGIGNEIRIGPSLMMINLDDSFEDMGMSEVIDIAHSEVTFDNMITDAFDIETASVVN